LSIFALSSPVLADNGLVNLKSAHDVEMMADRLEVVLVKKE
jgi:hypothetical protein